VIETLAYDRGGRSKAGAAFVAERGVAGWSCELTAADGMVTAIRGCDVFEFERDLIRRKDPFRKVSRLSMAGSWDSKSGSCLGRSWCRLAALPGGRARGSRPDPLGRFAHSGGCPRWLCGLLGAPYRD
jgi:hypothetical protein